MSIILTTVDQQHYSERIKKNQDNQTKGKKRIHINVKVGLVSTSINAKVSVPGR